MSPLGSQGIYDFTSHKALLRSLRNAGYRVEPLEWEFSELPDRARGLVRSMELLCDYDGAAPFQVFLIELDAKRIRRTDLRTILEPFYRRWPQGEYLFIFVPVGGGAALRPYSTVAFVSPKRIRHDEGLAPKLQLRILALDPSHLYHTDLWVLREIQLEPHEQKADVIWRKHLAAFDVERVTRDFYEGYRAVLGELEGKLAHQKHVGAKLAEIHAFAQQLLNRLMFLYFVQKKGWLRWGDGTPDAHYLSNLWQTYHDNRKGEASQKSVFLNRDNPVRQSRTIEGITAGRCLASTFYDWLRLLFLDAFNRQTAAILASPHLPQEIKDSFLRMPYLNGGLFEENELDGLGLSVPDGYFEMLFDRFEGEEPGFMERYNFTVDESTPLEVEVAVDPEMLGKVYESLVAEEERHAAGIFYTPREEIDYMCRLSLVEYLHEQTGHPKDDLIPLVMEPRRLLERPEDGIAPFGDLSKTGQHEALRAVEKALRQVRVVDPAVGSGSFLVGMMKASAEIQQAIAQRLERKRFNEFDLKRRIIMENLYGVDVKDWAVRACELRLWLSLTIEAEEREIGLYTNPVLPKLSFRVRQGDSLVEEVASVPLAIRGAQAVPTTLQKRLARLAQEKADFFGGRSLRKPDHIEREEQKLLVQFLNQRIDGLQRRIGALRRELAGTQAELGLEGVAPKGESGAEEEAEARRRARIRELEERQQELIKARAQLATGKTPPFFVWEVGFGEVFAEKGGFDIVIGNPPYVRQEEIGPPTKSPDDYGPDEWREHKRTYKDQLARGLQALWGSAVKVDRKSDLYVYFYHAGLSLLREGGVFCFINSNSWLDVGYGAKLQDFLLRRMRILQVIDNQARRTFAESDVNTVIVLLQRPKGDRSCWDNLGRFVAYKKPFDEAVTASNLLGIERAREVTRSDDLRVYPIAQRDLLVDGAERPEEAEQAAMDFAALDKLRYGGGKWGGKYLRAPDIFFTILEKGKGKLVNIEEVADVFYGLKTGANDFFYLDRSQILSYQIPAAYVRPILAYLRDVRKYSLTGSELTQLLHIPLQETEIPPPVMQYIEEGRKQGIHMRASLRSHGADAWYRIRDVRGAQIVLPQFFDRRFAILYSPVSIAFSNVFWGIVPKRDIPAKRLAALLNSSIVYLQIELMGRCSLGEGVLTLYGPDIMRLMLPCPDLFNPKLDRVFDKMLNRDILSIEQEVNEADRILLDRITGEALGLTATEQQAVREHLVVLVNLRRSKAESLKKEISR